MTPAVQAEMLLCSHEVCDVLLVNVAGGCD